MAYTKTTWQDRVVQNPNTYTLQNNANGTTTLLPAEGTITTTGTPINSSALNNIETQYDQAISFVKSFGLGGGANSVNGTDLNNIGGSGFYVADRSNVNTLNAPPRVSGDSSSIYIIHIQNSYTATYEKQIAYDFNNVATWQRANVNGAWTSWVQIPSFNDFAVSKGGSGYQKLPSGLIIQWGGTGSTPINSGTAVLFPISFPISCVTVSGNPSTATPMGTTSFSKTQFVPLFGTSTANFTWIAIGY